jgi:AcrR family transcriptional regulator
MTKANDQGDRSKGMGVVGGTAADRGRTVRLRLLYTAAELIAELGWTAVSTRILAERAGVTPGLVHYHFPSLQALLRDAALGMVSDLLCAAEAVFDEARTLGAGLDMMLASLDAHTATGPTSLLLAETYLAATRDEVLRSELSAVVAEFQQQLTRWLAEHGASTPDGTAVVLAAALDGLVLHRGMNPRLTSATVAPVLRRLASGSPA